MLFQVQASANRHSSSASRISGRSVSHVSTSYPGSAAFSAGATRFSWPTFSSVTTTSVAALIREKLPDVVIEGQIAPFLVRNGSPDAIRDQVASDFAKAGATGKLVIATAGSLAAGTGVGRMRYLMQVVQDHTRYGNR